MRLKKFLYLFVSVLLVATGASSTGAAPQSDEVYIIKFADNVNLDNEIAALKAGGAGVEREYRNVFKGAAVRMNAARAEALAKNPRVEILEKDGVVTTQAIQLNPPSWGLDRIDQKSSKLDRKYTYEKDGSGIYVYVIDTGILKHPNFGDRVVQGVDTVSVGDGTNDCNGHGTHVGGTIGSVTYGVSKKVTLVPVKVLNCSGSGEWSQVIAGIDWIIQQTLYPKVNAVANMSLGGEVPAGTPKTLLEIAVENLISRGTTVVIAAGNSNKNACNFTPARVMSAITVGATTSNDSRASYSNFGNCLDLFAPGSAITSTYVSSTGAAAVASLSGTSMASPHVAGVVARYLQAGSSSSSAVDALTSSSLVGVVKGSGTGSPNRLLYWDPAK